MGKCTTCSHASRAEIDAALVRGESLRQLSARFGVGKSSLGDHKNNHLAKSLRGAAERSGEAREDSLLEEVRSLQGEARKILREARKSKDHPAALAALSALVKFIELLGKMRPEPKVGPTGVRHVFDFKTSRFEPPRYVLEVTSTGFEAVAADNEPPVIETTASEQAALPAAHVNDAPGAPESASTEPPQPERVVSAPRPARIPAQVQQSPVRHWMEARVEEARREDEENAVAASGIGKARFRDY